KDQAFCTVCKIKIVGSLTHIRRHEQSSKHTDNYLIRKQSIKIEKFVDRNKKSMHEKEIFSAELKLIMFLHEHNLPYLLMEHLSKLLRSICPDSNIAKNISIIIDETTDVSIKNCRITKKNTIPLENILEFAADNAAVMMGQKSSVQTKLRELNKDIFTLGCVCHSLHLCSSKATIKLPKSVEEFVRNLYNHFNNSPKQRDDFKYQKFLDLKPHKMLRPSQTRWLSLQAVIDRVLLLWDSFKLYFTNAVFEEDKLHLTSAILDNLNNPVFKIYLLFLSYILDIINKMNLIFQGEGTQIHILHTKFSTLYKNVLRNFIKKTIIDQFNLSKILPTNSDYYVKLEEIYMGANVELFLKTNFIHQEELNKIRINILNFYIELCEQIRKRFDFNDKHLIFLTNFQPKQALSGNVSSITDTAILLKNLVSDVESLNSEWRQLQDIEYLKKFENASFDQFWLEVFQMKNELNEEMFPNLKKLIKGLMCLPHSSACVERIFSQLSLIKTKLRNKLDVETCSSIILPKQLMADENCYTWNPSETLLQKRWKC
ncbi:hypothetical protein ALC57_07895, partial [Trachymyrmex cornetzi]